MGRRAHHDVAREGQWRSRCFGAGLAVSVVAAILTGCSIFHKRSIGETPSPSTLDDVQSVKILPHKSESSAPVVGLALGGGGLRGYAHIGVLQALEESGVSVAVVAGTSAGSIVGAAYASGRTIEEIRQAAENLDVSSLTDWRLSAASLLHGDALAKWASDMAQNMPIEKMPRRFGAVAAILDTGEAVLIDKGDVGMAIRASAAIPGSMPPVESTLGMLVDGGISSLVPVRFARAMGAEVVIGVDVYCNSPPRSGSSFLTTIARASRTQTCLISGVEREEADILITPSVEITDMKSTVQREEAILAGYHAAKSAMPALFDAATVGSPP
ncbi:patatin-like phospholipase family protein [Alloalcanivorax xenomutans]|nr:patatin-like phospholipase family protein [Alloalcanivorax xenomutans]